ncbi:hypothetical protein J0X14_16300 [Muricauda sp. CAU 1633]|uniref:hypothetical protein n=1 Tax=Allomuricauda sp. CAU 1633 TaxID=2816036 RepID=UPI001A8C1C8D|nr:hypothetical protein [Muricauda sp. CAU 1633]MBO0323873.1 hypothetical protein [Muricauda sp. CAU 1633]
MANKSKNEQSINQGILTSHVFTQNGMVFLRSAEEVGADEWSAINFHWMPVLQLERELGS